MQVTSDPDRTAEIQAPQLLDTAGRAGRLFLLGLSDGILGELFPLRRTALTLGRAQAADLRLCESGVSRLHARLVRRASGWLLTDLGSRNGTRVNHRRVRRTLLHDGDLLWLGSALLRFGRLDGLEARYLRRMQEAALRDGLTRIFNKRYFAERLRGEVAHAARHGRPLSLLLLDVDHFKRVNDEHGHPAGDRALRAIATALRRATRSEDVLARCGGEEFAVLCRGLALEAAAGLADRARRTVAALRLRGPAGRPIPLTVSVGVATLAPDSREGAERMAEDLLARADEALYRAKAGGRDRVQVGKDGT